MDRGTCPSKIQIAAGERVILPWMDGDTKLAPPLLSLLELRNGHLCAAWLMRSTSRCGMEISSF